MYTSSPRSRLCPIYSLTGRSANRQRYGNHEKVNKSKGPNDGSGL
ncbi:protein of unknown function [Bradyrhizobium vignae]|uniref:Uncharacterized protein n=1 Tax=Bradyrhizobium vignae TaxID=1549949 RepID=A0A2U3Q0U2_9BRAD|nr:protein of unknown function [Bradyrhizobium vignae]